MGIRFLCPQGHKLNVKSFLAGKKGFCPHCNARVDIPLTSTRVSSKATTAGTADYDDVSSQIAAGNFEDPFAGETLGVRSSSAGTPDSSVSAGTPTGVSPSAMSPVGSSPTGTSPITSGEGGVAVMPGNAASPPGAVPQSDSTSTPASTVIDPIAEAPDAVWYVRPRTGGQYGPTSADALQQWIREGRVAADTYVWRDGWPDWRLASESFPNFQGASTGATTGPVGGPVGGPAASAPGSAAAGSADAGSADADAAGVENQLAYEEPADRPIRRIPRAWLVVLMSVVALILIPVAIYFVFF